MLGGDGGGDGGRRLATAPAAMLGRQEERIPMDAAAADALADDLLVVVELRRIDSR